MQQVVNKSDFYREIELKFVKVDNNFMQDTIDECIKCRVISFNRFLATKVGYKDIKHRKIVQKIFYQYIPDNQSLEVDLEYLIEQNQKENNQNQLQLEEAMKLLPVNLQLLKLFLTDNNLIRGNAEEKKLLEIVFKYLPKNLQNLRLIFQERDLSGTVQNFKLLGNMIGKSSGNYFLHLSVMLYCSYLGERGEELRYFGDGMRFLSNKVQGLELQFYDKKLGENTQNLVEIGGVIKQIPRNNNLKYLKLGLLSERLGKNTENLLQLVEGIKQLPYCLERFSLDLFDNQLGKNSENLRLIGEGMKQLPMYLKELQLNLNKNQLGENAENLRLLGEGMKQFPNSLKYLDLSLLDNNLGGGNGENLKYLGLIIQQLLSNLENLTLSLSGNCLSRNDIQKLKDDCLQGEQANKLRINYNY